MSRKPEPRESAPKSVERDDEAPLLGPVCGQLRTKQMHVLGRIDAESWQPSSTAQYWCLRTMQDFGPDDDFACPEDCQASRRCYSDE